MKNIAKILFSAVLVLGFFSCTKFLDLKPVSDGIAVENKSSDSILYKTASEAEAALAGVYGDFRNEYFELDYFVNGDAQSDDAYAGADNPANFQIDDYNIDATNLNVTRDWAYLYATIGKANAVIDNVNNVPDVTLTADRKKQIIGEASFIRAFMYFQLVQLWGDVPIVLKSVRVFNLEILPMLFPPRNTTAEVYAQIIKDLETALSSVKATAINKGYATTGAVNAMLAKVYATQEPHDWNKVNTYCDAVIAGGYSLLPQYDQLWDNAHENSAESIFEINYEGTNSSGNWGVGMFVGLDWKKFDIPSNDLVAAFDAENDAVRKNSSINWLNISGKWSDQHWPQTNYPFIHKYRLVQWPSAQNYIFIRLADILLLKAEALNQNGDVAGAAALVNQIRHRVNLPNTSAGTKDAMALAIEKERRLELAFEGVRWFDLKRTGRVMTVINALTNFGTGVTQSYNLTGNRLIWPIPQAEMDKNTQLVQNPGY